MSVLVGSVIAFFASFNNVSVAIYTSYDIKAPTLHRGYVTTVSYCALEQRFHVGNGHCEQSSGNISLSLPQTCPKEHTLSSLGGAGGGATYSALAVCATGSATYSCPSSSVGTPAIRSANSS